MFQVSKIGLNKEKNELDKQVIQRNTDIVQFPGSKICGHLCLYVLKSLSNGMTFRDVLNSLSKNGEGIKWSNPLADELHRPVIFQKDMYLCEMLMIFGVLILLICKL